MSASKSADQKPVAIRALDAAPRTKPSNYPEPFFSRMGKRTKRPLGDLFGLSNFGVNITHIHPGGESALRHAHTKQDEFIYIVAGHPTLITDAGETALVPGMCAGFKAGTGDAHHLVNRTTEDVIYLEIGDRSAGDAGSYPDDDLVAEFKGPGQWAFLHKDGTLY
ncbi:MAG TPA: cupin domain-containing protein [Alphaproteobacteria bacterium]|nr:cupin domain-containing protein [Alphaproteobacteria bacterium]